jgi:protein-S-isoprenylcysteine O-methyltransferase Ste14
MIEPIAVTALPVLFLATLFGGGAVFRRRNIDMDGKAPINKALFYSSKYAIVFLWAAAVARAWGVDLSIVRNTERLTPVSLCLWGVGFLLLFAGRFGLGSSFRIGAPKESTALRTDGLFALSRNPMYLGVYSTLLGATLYTLNPAVLLIGVYVVAVHHKIVLAEEGHLKQAFGGEYADYCRRVRRYL